MGQDYSGHVCKELEASPENRLPFLLSFRGRHAHFHDLLTAHLKARDSAGELQECVAFSVAVEDHIRPAWLQAIWSDEMLYANVLRPLYETDLCWPLRNIQSWRQRARILGPCSDISESLYRLGLEAIARRLGESKFFGGDSPSALDACIGADLILIPFFLPASHRLHREFMELHGLYEYSLHLLEFLKSA